MQITHSASKAVGFLTKRQKGNASLRCATHMFRSSYFWFLVIFGDKVTKILRNLCLHFARQDGQDGKKQERKSRN